VTRRHCAAVLASALSAVLAFGRPAAAEPVRLQILVLETPDKAEQALAQLKAGGDFATLARAASVDASGKDGGNLGEIEPEMLGASLQQALEGVAPGHVTGIVKLPTGYAILKVVSRGAVPKAGAPPRTAAAARKPAAPARPKAAAQAEATPEDPAVAAGRPKFGSVKYEPSTSGANDADLLFRKLSREMPAGWNYDLKALCEVRQGTVAVSIDRLGQVLSNDPVALSAQMSPHDIVLAFHMLGLLEAYDGRMDRALAQWERGYAFAKLKEPDLTPMLEEVLGTGYLHKAEMDNDVYSHPGDRCLFPPSEAAAVKYAKTEDAAKAVQYLTRFLASTPDGVAAKWLLNLAYMGLGKYPEGVPPAHRIPPSAFAAKGSAPHFVDVAPETGLGDLVLRAGGMAVDDFDGDGLLDVMVTGYDVCDRLHYLHNDGSGRFSDRSVASGVSEIPGGLNIVQADYNNDGCMDLLVLRGAWQLPMPVSLLKNNCDGTFTDVTAKVGLRDQLYATQAAAWADIDNDGLLDLFIGNEQGQSRLFHQRSDGSFEDVTKAAGIDFKGFTKGITALDYDNDGYSDFYVSNMRGGDNVLYHNNHDGTFTDVAAKAGVNASYASFSTWAFDYDNDGWTDILVNADYASVDETMRGYLGLAQAVPGRTALYRNRGDGTFENVAKAVGLDKVFMPMGANFGDVDNDGYLDVYLATGAPDFSGLEPKVLLHNDAGKTFTDVSAAAGIGDLHKGHGTAFADMENRGQEDIVGSMGGATPSDAHALRLFRNPGNDNDWITLKLVGAKSNRAALGARIKVTVESQGHGTRTIYRTVTSGGSFGSSPLEQHVGLGPGARIVSLEVFWPASKTTQTFKDVPVRQFLKIEEQASAYVRLERKQYRLGAAQTAAR
jgi:hypothetical protein